MKFEQNRMVQATQTFELIAKKKNVFLFLFLFLFFFLQRVDAILEDVSVAEIIV